MGGNRMANKFFSKILNFIGLEENIIEDDMDEYDVNMDSDRMELDETPIRYNKQKKGKIVNIHSSAYVKVVVYQPLSYDDTQNIIDNLKNRKPVIVNLDCLDVELAQRVLDFMSGAVYALDGTIHKVSKGIFVLAPNNVDISGNIPDELKGKAFFTLNNKRE